MLRYLQRNTFTSGTGLFLAGLQLNLVLATKAQQTLVWEQAHSLGNFPFNSVQ